MGECFGEKVYEAGTDVVDDQCSEAKLNVVCSILASHVGLPVRLPGVQGLEWGFHRAHIRREQFRAPILCRRQL